MVALKRKGLVRRCVDATRGDATSVETSETSRVAGERAQSVASSAASRAAARMDLMRSASWRFGGRIRARASSADA